jgi:hypothetical protein
LEHGGQTSGLGHSHLQQQLNSFTIQLCAALWYSLHDSIEVHGRARVHEDGVQQLELFSSDSELKHRREVAKL